MKEQKNKPSESSIQAQLACMLASAQQRPECSMFIGEPCTSQPDPDHNLLPPHPQYGRKGSGNQTCWSSNRRRRIMKTTSAGGWYWKWNSCGGSHTCLAACSGNLWNVTAATLSTPWIKFYKSMTESASVQHRLPKSCMWASQCSHSPLLCFSPHPTPKHTMGGHHWICISLRKSSHFIEGKKKKRKMVGCLSFSVWLLRRQLVQCFLFKWVQAFSLHVKVIS